MDKLSKTKPTDQSIPLQNARTRLHRIAYVNLGTMLRAITDILSLNQRNVEKKPRSARFYFSYLSKQTTLQNKKNISDFQFTLIFEISRMYEEKFPDEAALR